MFKLPKKQNKQNNIENSPNYKFYSKILNHGFDPIHLKAAVAIKNEMEIKSIKQKLKEEEKAYDAYEKKLKDVVKLKAIYNKLRKKYVS